MNIYHLRKLEVNRFRNAEIRRILSYETRGSIGAMAVITRAVV